MKHYSIGQFLYDTVYAKPRRLILRPPPPDPWPPEVDTAVRRGNAVPVCHRCFTPQINTGWFCFNCGTAIGSYNNVLPYIRIFSVGEVLRAAVAPEIPLTRFKIVGYVLLVSTYAPFLNPIAGSVGLLYLALLCVNRKRLWGNASPLREEREP